MIYNSLIKPHLEYGITIWGSAPSNMLSKVKKQQKRAIRYVNKAKFNAHTDPLFYKLKTLKFEDIYSLKVGEFMFKHIKNVLPQTMLHEFSSLNSTRSKNFLVALPKSKQIEHLPKQKFPSVWNNFSSNIKNSKSLNVLKKSLKGNMIGLYNHFQCHKRNCYPCKKWNLHLCLFYPCMYNVHCIFDWLKLW